MELFGINGTQYIVLIASMLLVFFIMREMELRETVVAYSEMIQLMEEWINDPHDVSVAQHKKDIHNHIKRLWHNKDLRFTLIRGDGVVLLDGAIPDHRKMSNHLSRAEIQDALVYGRGVAVRKSPTIGETMIYVSEPIETPWGTLYARLAAKPSVIQKNHMARIMTMIVGVTGVTLIKLC